MKNWILIGLLAALMSSCSSAKYSVGDCFDVLGSGVLEVTEVKDSTYVLTFSSGSEFFVVDVSIERSIDYVESEMLSEGIVSYRCEK